MKNKIIVCFMSLLGFASCSDNNEVLSDTTFSDAQTSSLGDWVASVEKPLQMHRLMQ